MKKIIFMLLIGMTVLAAQNGSGMKVTLLNPTDASPRLSIELSIGANILTGLHLNLPAGLQAVLESASLNNSDLWVKMGFGRINKKNQLMWGAVKNGLDIHYFNAQPGDVLRFVIRPNGRHLKRFRLLKMSVYPPGIPVVDTTKKISAVQIPLNYIKTKKQP